MLAKLWPLTKVGVKVGLCGGSLHYTHQAGIWGDSKQGEAAWKNLQNVDINDKLKTGVSSLPMVGEELAPQLPHLSLPEEVTGVTSTVWGAVADFNKNKFSYYNSGVRTVIGGIQALPDTVTDYAMQGLDAVQELAK